MASSSSYRIWKYDVFMSFNVPDVPEAFISNLRKHFNSNGITMFEDNEIKRGLTITPKIAETIRESRISIVVLSKKYAASTWCLDELLEIMKCKADAGQTVIPVFYGVHHSDVQKQAGDFGMAFDRTCAGRTEEKKINWSQALINVTNIIGVDSRRWDIEADMIRKIADDVSNILWPMESRRKVDIFLSFCSEADSLTFSDILLKNGIDTFKSYRCLEKSLIPIDKPTLDALEVSKVAVVMISEKKPCTVGFLEELRVILEYEKKDSLTVIPVLHTSDPLYVVEEEICQQYPENAPSWRNALTKLANIAAKYPFSQNPAGMDQSDWLDKITHDIFLLCYSKSNDLNALVAMDRHMKVVYDLLALDVNNEVRTIGIWGCVGVGKTTLARHIYAEISVNFQTHVFLENIENMKEDPTVILSLDHNEHEIMQARRKHRKVLLIVDDLNDIGQGKWIIEYANQFAPGSRVILISENKNLLVDAGVLDVYEVTSLRYDEALQLLSHFAFKKPYPPPVLEQLAVRAVHLAGFLPLSLRLLGSFLNGRDREDWVAVIKTMQGENIEKVWILMEATQDKDQGKRKVAAD